MEISFLPISWDQYHALVLKLSAAILSSKTNFDEIVAISRGGLTLGHLFSDFLRIPIYTLAIQSYTDIKAQGEIHITGKLQTTITNKSILLVDDISDSGITLKRATNYLNELHPQKITTATLFTKPKTTFIPDYYAKTTDKWVIFPCEVTETILSVTNMKKKEKNSKADIQQFLENLGYTKKQIAFVWKHYMLGQ
jgi:uncharacterized protein